MNVSNPVDASTQKQPDFMTTLLPPEILRQRLPNHVEARLRGASGIVDTHAIRATLFDLSLTDEPQVRFLAQTLLELLPADAQLNLTIDDISRHNMNGAITLAPTVHVYLFTAEGRSGLTYETFFHELLHGVTALSYGTIRKAINDQGGDAASSSAFTQFAQVWNEFRAASKDDRFKDAQLDIAVTDSRNSPDEFFTHALTNSKFQRYLAGKRYEGKGLLFKFRNWVKRSLFGHQDANDEPSWLDAALQASGAVLETLGESQNRTPVAHETVEAFTKWFGTSAVVDEKGHPRVVYHGTTNDFSTFDGSRKPWHLSRDQGKFYFYEKATPASEYAEGMGEAYTDGGANVMPVYLSLQRPYIVDVDGEPSAEWDMAGGRIEREAPLGTDGYIIRGIGFDDEPLTMYVALRPEQIKSSIGNSGAFDPSNPSILQDRSIIQEASQEFMNWFGESKTVDQSSGRPLVLYHGTTGDVSAFNPAFAGSDGVFYGAPAFFATTDPKLASDYAVQKLNRNIADAMRELTRYKNEHPGVYGDDYETRYQAVKDAFKTVTDGREFGNGANVMPVYMALQNPLTTDGAGQRFMQVMPAAITQAVEDGHDGVIVHNVIDHASPASEYPASVYIAFKPEQIKSALANSGRFDPNTSDILHSRSSLQETTAEFKNWFGSSHVVDGSGSPLRMYHGTNAEFASFDLSRSGNRDPGFFGSGAYFTPDRDAAEDYADSAVEDAGTGSPHVIESYLSIQNPFIWDMSHDATDSTIAALSDVGIKRSSVRGDSACLSTPRERETFNRAVRARGHDGVIVKDEDGIREVVVFHPHQVKSATYNSGAFDPNSAEFMLSRSNLQESTAAFQSWFAGSTVTDDETGRPAVAYHGAVSDFNIFCGNEITGWFSSTPGLANSYTEKDVYDDEGENISAPNILPVYLSIKRPLRLDFDMNKEMTGAAVYVAAGLTPPDGAWLPEGDCIAWETVNTYWFEDAAKAAGFDGIEVNQDGERTWAIFHPSQAKSAIGNNGCFNPEDENILMSRFDAGKKMEGSEPGCRARPEANAGAARRRKPS